jgi:AraC-like DNA-binding protein
MPAVSSRYWKPANDFLCVELEPGAAAPHLHDEWQFAVPSQPAALLLGAFSHSVARAGDITVVRPHDVHGESAGGSWNVLLVGPRFCSLDLPSSTVADPAAGAELTALLRQSRDRLVQGQAFEAATLGWIARLINSIAARPTPRRVRQPRPAVERARAHLIQHPAESLRLEELASVAGVGASHLVRSFSLDVGLPPRSYHAQVRLALARRLLAEGRPATWVAYECGFADQSHLNRRFKEWYGLPPGVFQAQCLSSRLAGSGSDAA